MKKLLLAAGLAALALLVVPVLIAQLRRPEPRHFRRPALQDAAFSEVSFPNAGANLQLAGMLFVPQGNGPFPAAVIIHGSGPSRRENAWYLTLTGYLQAHGVVVLLPDKRGSEASAGDWRTASFEDLAGDAEAAIAFLRHQHHAAISTIGVIGMSQGGLIAPLVAERHHEPVGFVVDVVGGALPMHETLVYEESHNLRELGLLPGIADALAYPSAWSIIRLRQREFWRAIGNFDPLPHWRRVDVPALILYGENDTNVPTQASVERLRVLANPSIEVRVFAGSGHALESPEGTGDDLFRPDALQAIQEFIAGADQAGGAPAQ
jgi:pimeloyl-ACP methyl ester carboxylesterase